MIDVARYSNLILPGVPGQTVPCERSSDLMALLDAIAKGMRVKALKLHCVAGAAVGLMANPTVRRHGNQHRQQFVITGQLTHNQALDAPVGPTATFRWFVDGFIPKHRELTTISGVRVTF